MQQQPLEERLASLETSAERHEQTIARLTAIAEDHDQIMERLVANQEYLQENLKTLQTNQDRMQANHEAILSLLEELTRDAANTRRLWLRLAQRYGWIDDEHNGNQPETPA
ncbi:MAG: hypothetical protein OXR67_01000 [Chloroflexota bacterium]|nr:hypothetical protein [Chloroflexota bacterium]